METIDKFLSYLYSQDVKLWIEGNSGDREKRLRFSAPEEILTLELIAQLKERKAELVSFLTQASVALKSTSGLIQPISREETLPLSFAQQRLWFLEQLQPDSSTYNIPTAVRLKGFLNVTALEQSLNEIVRRHETLRANFTTVEGRPVQVIAPSATINLSIINCEYLEESDRETAIRDLATQEAQKPFNLACDPLIRVTLLCLCQTEWVVLLTLHHIIADGWSMEILIRELATLYQAFSAGEASPLPGLTIQYVDFAAWQRQWLQGEILEAQLSYWKEQLQGTLPILQLPTDFPRARVQTFRGANQTFSLSPELSEALKAFSQREGVTLFMTLLAAYKVLLYRYTGQEDTLVGSPIANRNRSETEPLIGFFVNTLILRSKLSGNLTFQALLAQVRETTWEAYDHQDLPFEKLVEELQPDRDLSYNPLFQVKFRLENAPTEEFKLPGLTLSSLKQTNPTAKLDLSLDMYETPFGLVGGFEYNKDLFEATTIARMVEHFRTLLAGIIKNPDRPIGELPLLSYAEQQQILVNWNATQTDYARNLCFHQIFEEQVEKNPDAVALIFTDEQLTYRELNRRSNQLAHYLRKQGVGTEVKVGIYIERSPEMIIALLGVFKAGGAYVPLDPAYPLERIAFMLSDSQVPVLLTQNKLVTGLPQKSAGEGSGSRFEQAQHQAQVVCLDTDWETIATESEGNPVSKTTTQNLAYLIYTSGSTGIPKGVLVTHEGLVNLTEDKIRACDVHPDSCVLQFFSFSFDASIPEIIMALGCGAKLCLAQSASLLPGQPLLTLLHEQVVTHITVTPSALATLPVEDLPALQMVLVGGEAPSSELIENWSKGRRFINAYGPTEVTVNASMIQCGNGYPTYPTIRPSANKQLYILDQNLQPVPVGVLGELHIGGIGLARGYLNRPERTAEAFIPNPFDNSELSSKRLYKTGDLACYLPNGSIKLFGRLDDQVKIRGFRIEPGEIEALLVQHPKIKASVVVLREERPEDKCLVAYILSQDNTDIIVNELRSFLKEKLPEYMIPSAFVMLDNLPLTPNGKVDRHALPTPDRSRFASEKTFVEPRTSTEEKVNKVFCQVLKIEQVSVYDDFFELGGHSLLATQLIAQLLQEFQVDLTIVDLFEAPTVADLAERIEFRQLQAPLIDIEEEREEIEI